MEVRYQLCKPDGEISGEAEYAYQPQAGDEVYVNGRRRMRVTAVVVFLPIAAPRTRCV